ncbi:MAG: response regulator [Planctomycetota bacterium]
MDGILKTLAVLSTLLSFCLSVGLADERRVIHDLAEMHEFKAEVGLFSGSEPDEWPKADCNGTVTYNDPVWNFVFIQKGEHSIFAYGKPVSLLKVGQHVRIRGEVNAGDLFPILRANLAKVLKRNVELPEPVDVSLDDLSLGEMDARRVAVKGRVLQTLIEPRRAILYCAEGDRYYYVSVANWDASDEGRRYVGSVVRSVGALGVQIRSHAFAGQDNSRRSIDSLRIFCASPDDVQVLDGGNGSVTPSGDPSTKQSTIGELASGSFEECRFSTTGQVRHIVKVDDHYEIVLFDEFDSVRIQLESALNLHVGMILNVAGSCDQDTNLSFKADYLHLLGHAVLPSLQPSSLSQVASDGQVDHRYRIRGEITGFEEIERGRRLWLGFRDGNLAARVLVSGEALENLDRSNLAVGQKLNATALLASRGERDGGQRLAFTATEPDSVELTASEPFPLKIFAGALIGFCGVMLWIWLLRRQVAERTKELQQLTANLRSSYDAIEAGVLAIDREKTVLAVNKEFLRISDLDLDPKVTTRGACHLFSQTLVDPTHFDEVIGKCASDENYSETFFVERAEPYIAIQVSTSPIVLSEGDQPIGRLWVMRDETEKRQLQKELTRTNKLEAVGRLAGGVAHDFNNILAAITSNLTVALSDPSAEVSDVSNELTMAREAAFRGADVSRRLLTFSSDFSLSLEPYSINELIEDLAKLVRHSFDANIEFRFNLDGAELTAKLEKAAIEQVLLNLYVNARDAMPDGGCIETETKVVHWENESFARIMVRDSGVGIPASLEDQIFDPFFSTKGPQEGTGLGLSTAYRVIKEHGGQLQLADQPKKGWTEFWIDLPLCSERPAKRQEKEAPAVSGLRVLVVDDEQIVRTAACQLLEMHGFETEEVCDGKQALEYLDRCQSLIQVVLLDLTMPGMSGKEVLAHIKQRWPHLPVVVCSGYVVDDFRMSTGGQPDAVVAKPYQMVDLIETFEKVTSRRKSA